MKGDVRAAVARAELLDLVGSAVPIRVAQREDLPESRLGVDVAIRRDGDAAEPLGGVPRLLADDEIVGDDQRSKPGGQRNRPIVWIR